jgi:hypothetical protein
MVQATDTATVWVVVAAGERRAGGGGRQCRHRRGHAGDHLVLANDFDVDGPALVISAVTQGANGSVVTTVTGRSRTRPMRFVGTDSFEYTVSDGSLTDTATVTVIVGRSMMLRLRR